ncbi:MAG: sirohydrochlorin cobaltochelatase [Candidatus Methanomethylophilaceae archaeon]|nr:sirohydrochlorin cobaltochelatase [Candidatus Methanomethylophilaceae archaeon]
MASKKALLVISFGTSYNENRDKTIGATERLLAESFPEWEVRRAFTSKMIIKKLKERDGETVDYIDGALDRLLADGFDTVIVQPTHIMNGTEYDFVKKFVCKYCDKFKCIRIGKPLLTSQEDYDAVIDAIATGIVAPAKEMAGNDAAVVLMGHGTEHFANATYSQLQLALWLSGLDDVYVTTVEGFPDFDDTMKLMKGMGIRNVVIQPFMLVAGDHANNDMAGDEDDSLKSVLEHNGYKVFPVIKGLGEIPEFRQLFVDHVSDVMNK